MYRGPLFKKAISSGDSEILLSQTIGPSAGSGVKSDWKMVVSLTISEMLLGISFSMSLSCPLPPRPGILDLLF